MDKEMQKALEADGEKLRQLTGRDHGPGNVAHLDLRPKPCPTCGDETEFWWSYCAMCGHHIAAG